jgi:hypothetical protein
LILAAVAGLPWLARAGRDALDRAQSAGIQAAMLGLIISSLFASFTLVGALYFWLLAALSAAMSGSIPLQTKVSKVPAMARIAAAVGGCVLLIAGISLAVQDYQWSELAYAVADKSLARATDAFSAATRVSLGFPGYELFASREFAALGRALGNGADSAVAWRAAADASALAEKRGDERFNAAYQSSVLAVAASDIERAEAEARVAVGLAPNWYKAHLLLSQILQIRGESPEASREAEVSKNLGWKPRN